MAHDWLKRALERRLGTAEDVEEDRLGDEIVVVSGSEGMPSEVVAAALAFRKLCLEKGISRKAVVAGVAWDHRTAMLAKLERLTED